MTQGTDDGMSKYGVDETSPLSDEVLEKQAARGCPRCGRKVERHGNTLLCPEHGSEPFERT